MAQTRRTPTVKNRASSRGANSPARWRPIALVVGILLLAVAGWYLYDQIQSDATAEHSHGESAEQLAHVHGDGEVELPHIHGMGFSQDGEYLYVAAHEGLRAFADGEWLVPDLPVPVLGLYGTDDDLIEVSTVDEAQRRNQHGTWILYEGAGHAFLDVDADQYHADSAADARARLVEFFKSTLPRAVELDLG